LAKEAEAPIQVPTPVRVNYAYSQKNIIRAIRAEAPRYQIEPAVALAIAETESNFNPNAIRPEPRHKTFSVGLFQMFIPTARSMGFAGTMDMLKNPKVNIRLGLRHLQKCVERFGPDNLEKIACCHNAGPAVEESFCDSDEGVQDYIEKVQTNYEHWKI
jgi:soluble lytic murein transglycosylase-like protein